LQDTGRLGIQPYDCLKWCTSNRGRVTMDNDIERQKKLEADAVRDGLLRYAKSYEYHLATDSKPVRDVLGHCLKPVADVIRAEQLKLKTSQGQKLEKYLI